MIADWARSGKVEEKCQAVLLVIAEHRKHHHAYGPTVEEIREAAGISTTSLVSGYLKRLKAKGLVEYSPRVPRSVEPTLMGWIRAGIERPCSFEH